MSSVAQKIKNLIDDPFRGKVLRATVPDFVALVELLLEEITAAQMNQQRFNPTAREIEEKMKMYEAMQAKLTQRSPRQLQNDALVQQILKRSEKF